MQQWSARVAGFVEGLGFLLSLGAAVAVGVKSLSLMAAAGVFLLAFAAVTVASGILNAVLETVGSIFRGIGSCLLAPPRPDPLAAWPTLRLQQSGLPGRPVAFHSPGSDAEAPPPLTATDNLTELAQRAVDTVDLLTRRTLFAGDHAFICLGQNRTCGAAFHDDIRDDLRDHYEDRCPACGTQGAFAHTVLPAAAAAPPPLPEELRDAAADEPSPPPLEPVHPPGYRPLVFRTAS